MIHSVVSPLTTAELLKAMRHTKNYRFGAGCTDLLLDLKKFNGHPVSIINLAQLRDLQFSTVKRMKNALRVGALTTASAIVDNPFIAKQFPVLREAALQLASTQIRNVATIGGNICTASPSGDLACALVALDAICELLSANGKTRQLPIRKFFKGPRLTAINKNEILRAVVIPFNKQKTKVHSGFIKIGTRKSMECSVVSLAYHLQADYSGKIKQAGLAIGAAAPVIRFTEKSSRYLCGKNIARFSGENREEFAEAVVEYASPISDLRASAWYRKEVLFNISKSILENIGK